MDTLADPFPLSLPPFHILAVNPQTVTVLILLLVGLLLVSFFVSGAEVAFFSLAHRDINMLKTKQHPAARRIISLLDQPKQLHGTLHITNTFVNISIIIVANVLMDEFLPQHQALLNFFIKLVSVVFVLVLFGEVLPRVWASQNNIRFAYSSSLLVDVLKALFQRIGIRFVNFQDQLEKGIGSEKGNTYSLEDIDQAIDMSASSRTSEEEKNILRGIAKFGNITTKQIMRTRLDVSAVEFNTSFADLIKRIEELNYSRLPVYKNNLDDVVGIIHTKDVLPHVDAPGPFDWHGLLRQPYFVHEQKLVEDLLREFQRKGTHFAVVVDEFGGTEGIITLEDIMEEIIGDIRDEFDDEESANKKLDDQNFIFEGRTMIKDACRAMDLDPDTFDEVKGDSESLAGLVLELAGEIPMTNQIITVGDFDFTVVEIEKNRIKKVKVTIKTETTNA